MPLILQRGRSLWQLVLLTAEPVSGLMSAVSFEMQRKKDRSGRSRCLLLIDVEEQVDAALSGVVANSAVELVY